jgi:hypothetical protein
VIGNWDASTGNNSDTIGVYQPNTSVFYLRNSNSAGGADLAPQYGPPGAGWLPATGDWNADHFDTIGLYDRTGAVFFLRNSNTNGPADRATAFGPPGNAWTQLAGDWDGTFHQAGSGLLADVELDASGVAPLTDTALAPVVVQAIARWFGANPQAAATMAGVRFEVTDLPGAHLGWAYGDTIYLDRDAAGHGWFIDPTPALDEEFRVVQGERVATDPRAVDRIDLVTVVEHELGHVAGFEDLDASSHDLMSGTLRAGVRHAAGAPSDLLFGHVRDWR